MKKLSAVALVFFTAAMAFLMLFLASPKFRAEVPVQEKWEYKVVNIAHGLQKEMMGITMDKINKMLDALIEGEIDLTETEKLEMVVLSKIEESLNKYGDDGWELMKLEDNVAFFKRRKK